MPDGTPGLEVSVLARVTDLPEGALVPSLRGTQLMPVFAIEVPADLVGGDRGGQSWHDGVVAALGATWLLMAQPALTDTTAQHAPARPGAQRRSACRGEADEVVRVVDLHASSATTAIAAAASTTEHSRRHRWIVRGHWRRQRYGVRLALSRPTWIEAYIAGPADAPLLRSDTVRVWRR